jgi:hypothetical protein
LTPHFKYRRVLSQLAFIFTSFKQLLSILRVFDIWNASNTYAKLDSGAVLRHCSLWKTGIKTNTVTFRIDNRITLF